MLRKIWNLLGDNWLLIIGAIAIVITARMTKAEDMVLYPCPQRFAPMTITKDITVTGDPWTEPGGYYSAPGDKVTAKFPNGDMLTITVSNDEKFAPAARILSWLDKSIRGGDAKIFLYEDGDYGLLLGNSCNEGILHIGPKD